MLAAYPGFSAEVVGDRYFVIFNGQKLPLYSERSGPRDLAELSKVVDAAAPGHTPIIVAPYADALREIFASPQRFFFIAPVCFSENPPADPRLIAGDEALERFVNDVRADEKFSIYTIPQWQAAHDFVVSCTRGLLERAAVRLKTIGHFEKLWQINFRANTPHAEKYGDIQLLRSAPPDALVMAGPSLDTSLSGLAGSRNIWCADTALPALLKRNLFPSVVFSIDAGFASREHFVGAPATIQNQRLSLVCDMLGNPGVQRLPFASVISYAGSHPLVQQFVRAKRPDLTAIENPAGDVGSLMRAIYSQLFGSRTVTILGHDGGHRRHVTHARGTAYFSRGYAKQNRLFNAETYMLRLSRRY